MTARWRGAAILTAAAAAAVVLAGACGKARKSGNGGGGGPSAVNEQVIAPFGFKMQITDATIPNDPTAAATPPTVTFTLSDQNGAPINDLKQELANAPATRGAAPTGYPYINAPRFTLARLDPDNNYTAQYLSNAGQPNQAAVSVTLPRDPTAYGQRVKENGNGSYTFQLDPLKTAPTSDERGRTFTTGTWASRRTSAGEQADEAATSTFNFVPSGGTPGNLQIVALQACNTCHAPAPQAHGTRLGTQLCLTCHTAQTHDSAGTSVEFVELIHKIHYGADRPGTPYTIAGFTGPEAFDDTWINDVRKCTLCHQGANADLHVSAPSLRACTTCHSIVSFDANSGLAPCTTDSKDTAPCSHQGGPQSATSNCATCHTAAAIPQQHTSIFTIAQDYKYELKSVTVGQDGKPVIQFDVLNKGQPMDLANDPAYKNAASSLNVQIGWPPKDYNNSDSGATSPGQPRSIAIVRGGALQTATVTPVSGQTNVYQVTSPVALPSGVTSFTVFMDGHPFARGENIPVTNVVQSYAANGGTPDQRRAVVSIDNCNACHGTLSWHGRNRNGSVETCVVCHNPHATDWGKRKGTAGESQPEAPIDFKFLIHAVHSVDIRKDPLTVYEFNAANAATGGAPGTPEEFPGLIPHGVANCTMCHQGTTYEPPISADAQDTTISTQTTPPTTMPKTMAVCTSCHDQVHFDAASSSLKACNTLTAVNSEACFHTGGAQTGDASCASCHGKGGAADVQRVHNVQ